MIIINLIIYASIIIVIIFLINKLYSKSEKFTNTNNNTQDNLSEKYETINFDYSSNKTENINDIYNKELEFGVTLLPNYGSNNMLKGSGLQVSDNKDLFDYTGNVDQRAIYGDKLYTHNIHTERSDNSYNNKPIRELFDDSITDFKKISHRKEGTEGDFVINGGFNQGSFAPDFINYDNEKPENGGVLSGNDFYAFDPTVLSSTAIF